jgi:hypothetical protein
MTTSRQCDVPAQASDVTPLGDGDPRHGVRSVAHGASWAPIIELPARRRSGIVADGLLAGIAGIAMVALWASIDETGVPPVVTSFQMICLLAVGLTASSLIAVAEHRPALGSAS